MQQLVPYSRLVELGYVNNRVTLARRIERGEFPAPIRVGVRNVAWIKAELDAWEQARCAERAKVHKFAKAANAAAASRHPASFDLDRTDAREASADSYAAARTQAETQVRTQHRTQI